MLVSIFKDVEAKMVATGAGAQQAMGSFQTADITYFFSAVVQDDG